MPNLIGRSLGQYQILVKLGEGGMATAYKAYDTRLDREVAIKVIRREALPAQLHARIFKRFEREARSLAKLSHPNIVRVIEYGEDKGTPFLAMEYVPSGTLKARLGKPLDWKEAIAQLLPVAKALAYAHKQGIIHRDVKPSNILIAANGQPMLSDFGIAKMLEDEETFELTATGSGIGTPEYMAPEQVSSQDVDYRADIYALGVVFYEMVTGRTPFQGETPMAVMIKKATEPLPRPTSFVLSLPPSVERVLLIALAKKPADRFPNMDQFVEALEKIVHGQQPSLPPRPSIPKPAGWNSSGLNWNLVLLGLGTLIIICVFGIGIIGTKLRGEGQFFSPSNEKQTPTIEAIVELSTAINVEPPTPTATLPVIVPTPIATMISSKDAAELVFIPEGEFKMGSDVNELYFWGAEAPKHDVFLSTFWIYRAEVTNALYRSCEEAGACPRPIEEFSRTHGDYHTSPKYNDYPVVYVTFKGAISYCVWAGARLPTEAEWEKAARGTDGKLFPWGNEDLQNYYANFCDVGCPNVESQEIEGSFNDGYRDLAPVGSFPAGTSPYGAVDMAGNALEWVSDWYSSGYYSTSIYENPSGPSSGSRHPVRGGSWYSGRAGLRVAARASLNPKDAYDTLGFRCALDSP